MIISDLNHLEVVAEASSVVGGGKEFDIKALLVFPVKEVNQNNVSVLDQKADSTAVAISEKGNAEANSAAINSATVVQLNSAS